MSDDKAEVARQIGVRLQELIEIARTANLPMMEYLLATALAETDSVQANERRDPEN